jgi:Domain of unknown function (DUF4349)
MGQPGAFRFRLLWGILIGISIAIGILVVALVALRLAPVPLFANQGVDLASVSGLAALPPHHSADGLLQAAGNTVVSATSLSVEASRFEVAESRVIEITRQAGGFLEQFKVHRRSDATPWLDAELRLPARQLNSALAVIRDLGLVKQETEATEETGAEKESLSNQLQLERAELAHMNEIIRLRKGSLRDAVQAEEEVAARRSEINEREKELKKLEWRAEYALVEVQITERYQAHLNWGAAGLSSDLRNSSVEGLQILLVSFGAVVGFLLHYGLLCLPWAAILYLAVRAIRRRYRRVSTAMPASVV